MNILVLGAGKSATTLIQYLLKKSTEFNWNITVGDLNIETAQKKIEGHQNGSAIKFDVFDEGDKDKHIANTDIVVSLLPPSFHDKVATTCLKFGKHLLTASYVSPAIKAMHDQFVEKGIIFMGEIGLDPGIDHLAIMELVDRLKEQGAELTRVASYTGALIAPESDTNPWHYKFSWAPMNVIKAGQGISQYLYQGKTKYIPYTRLFTSYLEREVEGAGAFEIYPNRDSMAYIEKYGLQGIDTFLRGTMRYEGYCEAWNSFIKLGWTDDSYEIPIEENMTYTDLLRGFLPLKNINDFDGNLKFATAQYLGIENKNPIMHQLAWLGLFDNEPIKVKEGISKLSPAKLLCNLLLEKWVLAPEDKDMIVMLHEMDYVLNGKKQRLTSTMICKGNDAEDTAIAQTVGLPLGMMTKLVATGAFTNKGVNIPLMKEVYEPLLLELKEYGIGFNEHIEEID